MKIDQQIMREIWQPIPNYTRYEISTSGRVRHIRHRKILKQSKPHNGYLQVNIHNDVLNRSLTKCVHQLMALTFFCKKPKGFEVAHRDEKKENNHILNLCYLFWKSNRKPRTVKMHNCPICGKETSPWQNHCSRKCYSLANRTLVTCETCDKQFFRRNSVIKGNSIKRGYTLGRIFCSRKCGYKSTIIG